MNTGHVSLAAIACSDWRNSRSVRCRLYLLYLLIIKMHGRLPTSEPERVCYLLKCVSVVSFVFVALLSSPDGGWIIMESKPHGIHYKA